jgi:hypothetical protein
VNFGLFSFTLFWFWRDWNQLGKISGSIDPATWLTVWLAGWLTATISLAAWEWLRAITLRLRLKTQSALTNRYAQMVFATALGFLAFVFTILLNQPAPGIVYKAF